MRPRRHASRLLAAPLGLLWALAASVSGAGEEACGLIRAAARAPAAADLVVVVEGAATSRRTDEGRRVAAAALDALRDTRLPAAWADLSARLGWTQEDTFDRLLGRSVTVAARGVGREPGAGAGPTERGWVVIAEVSLETERRLRERLDVAPRTIVQGMPLLSVERGEFELALRRGRTSATVVFAPARCGGLLDEVASTLSSRRGGATTPDDVRRLSGLGRGEALALVRRIGPHGSGWMGMVVRREDGGLHGLSVTVDERMREGVAGSPAWSRAPFERMSAGALVAVMERPPVRAEAAASNSPASMGTILGDFKAFAFGPENAALMGDRVALVGAQQADGSVSLAAGMEIRCVGSAAAPADGFAVGALARLGVPADDPEGADPSAVRSARLPASLSAGLQAWAGQPVRWTYVRVKPTVDVVGAEPGWWVMGVGDEAFDRARSALASENAAESSADDEAVRRWLSLGHVRVSALLDAAERAGADLPPALQALRDVRALWWTVEGNDAGEMAGDVRVRFREATPEAPTVAGTRPAP